jgi:hypothetical protein
MFDSERERVGYWRHVTPDWRDIIFVFGGGNVKECISVVKGEMVVPRETHVAHL